ncbi:MAG: FHA domain-containing protein [Thiolinea sp.]
MAQIIISCNNQITKRVKLVKPSYTIGRNAQCDIVLPERTISNQHAKIINAGEDCFLEDTDSTNGIFLNHRLIKKHLLMDNDTLQIGKYQLTFRSAVGLVTQLRQLSVHPRLVDEPEHPWLEITNGRKQGNIIILEREQITLGNQDTGKITVERNREGEYLLHKMAKKKVKEVIKLNDNDKFAVGDVELIFHSLKEKPKQAD